MLGGFLHVHAIFSFSFSFFFEMVLAIFEEVQVFKLLYKYTI